MQACPAASANRRGFYLALALCVCGTMIPMEVHTIQSFLDYFSKIRERTMRVVACIPPDKIEWRAAKGKFTLGDLADTLQRPKETSLQSARAVDATVTPDVGANWQRAATRLCDSWNGCTANR